MHHKHHSEILKTFTGSGEKRLRSMWTKKLHRVFFLALPVISSGLTLCHRNKPSPPSSHRSSVCSRKPHLHGERDLRHTGMVTTERHGRPRRRHLQPPLQEVLGRWQEVHAVWQQRPFCSPTVWSHVAHRAGHRPAARLQLQLQCREPERSVRLKSHPQRNSCHQRHNIADRWGQWQS